MTGSRLMPSLAWVAAGLLVAALSIVTMSGELRGPRPLAAGPSEPLFGLSHRSATATLERCEDQLGSLVSRLQPTPTWQALLETCRGQATLVTERWPTDDRAWLLIATASRELGDQPAYAAGLRRSQQFSPAVQWIAQRRLALADLTDATGDYSYAADVLSLLESDLGARVLAASWLAGDAARRERIEAAADMAPPALQQRLLDKIREQVAAQSR